MELSALLIDLVSLTLGPLLVTRVATASLRLAFTSFLLVTSLGAALARVLPRAQALAGDGVLVVVAAFFVVALFGLSSGVRRNSGIRSVARVITLSAALLGLLAVSAQRGEPALLVDAFCKTAMVAALWTAWGSKVGVRRAGLLVVLLIVASHSGLLESAVTRVAPHAVGVVLAAFSGVIASTLLYAKPLAALERKKRANAAGSALGAVAALIVLFALPRATQAGEHVTAELGAGHAFLHLALESAPALLLGFAITTMMAYRGGENAVRWLMKGSKPRQTLKALMIAPALPFCSCGVLPIYRTLVLSGAAPTAAVAFLVATPELNFASILYSWRLLGPLTTTLRVLLSVVAAVIAGLVLGRASGASRSLARPTAEPIVPRRSALAALSFGFSESIEHVMPSVLVGLAAASLVEPLIDPALFRAMPHGADVVGLTLLGLPAYVCASEATPLAAVLLHKGVSLGAILAILLTGPASNVTTIGMLARFHGRRAALLFVGTLCGVAIGYGLIVNQLAPVVGSEWTLHTEVEDDGSTLRWIALAILGTLTLRTLARRGFIGFFGTNAHEHASHATGGCDDPSCTHDHAPAPTPLAPPAQLSALPTLDLTTLRAVSLGSSHKGFDR
jgi:uncharacterized protein